ncbi:hypothetical protein RI129_012254 [Pyrocoelia pectoralis]|uniref:Uncharacterized protein n=1 Tax=Pyrocoelia pectoralis TaxID=417401 RepID=A0AAN7UZW6_9COLE
MGKKTKKTRWRTLTLNAGHQSDSEESCGNQRKYTKSSYSSHSSPIRKFEHESSKTTRSNSTTSEKKATTFNEDEYTRITTPRQDVLFKKGYLNKPKLYQTQTSTGTCSTANSTSTCTPDHQSADGLEGTDMEYESQFVFPNGFIDQNGIYYINSFEPFPFVVYNAPICYTEYPNAKTKRYSTDSMTESLSPQNEESGVTNMSTQPSDEEQPVRVKKRRRRKISPSKSMTSEASSDDVFKTEEKNNSDAQLKVESKYELKPDAEEFIPRNLQTEAVPFDPNLHFFQHNFIPVPFINGDLQTPFVPVNFVSPTESFVIPPEASPQVQEAKAEVVAEAKKKTDIDIAKIVFKLEEAAKEQQGKKTFNRLPKARTFQRPRFNRYQNRERQTKTERESSTETCLKTERDSSSTKTWKQESVDTSERCPKPIENKTEIKVIRSPRKSNQWIPVAHRKKRKNKMGDDVLTTEEPLEEETLSLNDDLFESFDVNQLVDVVPPSQLVDKPEVLPTIEDNNETSPPQTELKKKKKKASKIVTKKVIVTDFPPQAEEPEVTHALPPSPPPPPPVCEESSQSVEEVIVKPPSETPEKKKKKKKKPVPDPKSISNCDDTSYDFLLVNSTLDDFEKKTNVEISEELDRIIQKGIYSNLEEKVKAMNIELDDSFFQILTRPSTSSSSSNNRGIFQWNLQEFQDKGEDNQNTPISLTNVQNFSVPPEPFLRSSSSSPSPPPSYPITKAVKEWMTKTRENTPDIEIFKSPNTIYKEFCDEDDDDVVLWSADEVIETNCKIEECEEAIEVYESHYGNNEDFLRIKGEIDAQKSRFAPRHSDLPYRAICCNLM